MKNLKRGDVVWVNLDPTVGAEIKKRRPCVIVSLSVLNDRRLTVVVVPLSGSSTTRPPLVVAVPSAGAEANARIDQIRAVDKSRVVGAIGKLINADMEAVAQGLRTVLGL
ncbi:MAG: type II toxin-antitoxin system PemK/MazF family toxin [Candidatus Binatia bacterium]